MKCIHCGHEIPMGSSFCPNCGAAVPPQTTGGNNAGEFSNNGDRQAADAGQDIRMGRPQPVPPVNNAPYGSAQPVYDYPPNRREDKSSLTAILGVVAGLLIAILAVVAYMVFFSGDKDEEKAPTTVKIERKTDVVASQKPVAVSASAESMKAEPVKTLSRKDILDIEAVISRWDEGHSYGNTYLLRQVYAPQVMIYGERRSTNGAIDVIDKLLDKSPEFWQASNNITVTLMENGDAMAEFDKDTDDGSGTEKSYPSYLVLKRSSNAYGWSIIKESDKITDRNLRK